MNYSINIRPEAEEDIFEALSWYEDKRPGLGKELLFCLEAELSTIQRNPLIFQKQYKQIRRALIRRFPYGIFYLIDDPNRVINVIAVFHAHRTPSSWKERTI
jgi:plasmid stabilization system protein ParE